MQKIFSIFFLFTLLIGAGCAKGDEGNLNETKTAENYRKVSITGTVTTRHSGAMDPETSGLVACLATGTYEINLWFPAAGGQALKQDNKLSNEIIEKLIVERKEARASKNWGRADEIRKELDASGIVLKDSPDGTITWSYK